MRYKKKLPKLNRLSGDDDFYQDQSREMLSFTGSLMDETPKNYRIAKLHKKITAQETNYHQKRRFIEQTGILSQWFETRLLDRVFSLLEKDGDRKASSPEEEMKKILAYIDVLLRLEGNSIRWKILEEVNEYFNFDINRNSLFKYRTQAQRSLYTQHNKKTVFEKLRKGPTLFMKRLISEYLANDVDLTNEQKVDVKNGCFQVISAMKNIRYVPRDHEIYAYGTYMLVKKGLTGKNGKYSFPVDNEKVRKAIANATYNIKMKVITKAWKSKPVVTDAQHEVFPSLL
jgi:hypothetical protein